jgi:hypothetical protein
LEKAHKKSSSTVGAENPSPQNVQCKNMIGISMTSLQRKHPPQFFKGGCFMSVPTKPKTHRQEDCGHNLSKILNIVNLLIADLSLSTNSVANIPKAVQNVVLPLVFFSSFENKWVSSFSSH